MKRLSLLISVCCFALIAASSYIQAYEVFFAEDIAPDLHRNAVPRIETPNSCAAFDDFLTRLSSDVYIEDFESFPEQDLTSPLTLEFGDAGLATVRDATSILKEPDSNATRLGSFPSSGETFLSASTTPGGRSFQIEFDNSEGIAALGFFGTDFESADIHLQFYDANDSLLFSQCLDYSQNCINSKGEAYSPSGSSVFFGITALDKPFSTVTFSSCHSNERLGFDDLVIATADQVIQGSVPEPGTLLLLGAGVLGLFGLRRKMKK